MADLRDIVQALGYRQVNLWGGSWGTRSALVSPEDHQAFVVWIAKRPFADFRSRLVAWNLSDAEAKRIFKAHIDGAREKGTTVINPAPAAPAPAPEETPTPAA